MFPLGLLRLLVPTGCVEFQSFCLSIGNGKICPLGEDHERERQQGRPCLSSGEGKQLILSVFVTVPEKTLAC